MAATAPPYDNTMTVDLNTVSAGNTAFAYLSAHQTTEGIDQGQNIRTREPTNNCGLWSHWVLIKVNAVSRRRYYGVYIYDSCNNDQQVFPVVDTSFNPCNNDDQIYASARYSMCPSVPKGTVPAGLPFVQTCGALTEASITLNATLTPQSYDATTSTPFKLTTSFSADATSILSEMTCSDVVDWHVNSWSIHWPDNTDGAQPGSAHDGISAAHTVPGDPAQRHHQTADVTVIAHLSVTGRAYDIDDNGNLVITPAQTRLLDVSNDKSANGFGAPPVYVPPQLEAGALGALQNGDGSLPHPDPTQSPSSHLNAIRGRLLDIFPRAMVIRPGAESIGGVSVGESHTRVLGWTYTGGPTDAPPGEATPNGAHGTPAEPIAVQYNHAERLDAQRQPVDEQVPVSIQMRTTWPDGHIQDSSVLGSIAVTIYYIGLDDPG